MPERVAAFPLSVAAVLLFAGVWCDERKLGVCDCAITAGISAAFDGNERITESKEPRFGWKRKSDTTRARLSEM